MAQYDHQQAQFTMYNPMMYQQPMMAGPQHPHAHQMPQQPQAQHQQQYFTPYGAPLQAAPMAQVMPAGAYGDPYMQGRDMSMAMTQPIVQHTTMPNAQTDPSLFYKTKLCTKYATNTCAFGDQCRYAHGQHELRVLPPELQQHFEAQRVMRTPINARPGYDPLEARKLRSLLHKTKLCDKFMLQGACPYNERCSFAHGEHELRAAQPLPGEAAAGAVGAVATTPAAAVAATQNGMNIDGAGGIKRKQADATGADEKRSRTTGQVAPAGGAGTVGPTPIFDKLPDETSYSLETLTEKFERLKNEVSQFASETGHQVALMSIGGVLSGSEYRADTEDYQQELYLKSADVPEHPSLKLAVLKYGTGGVSKQLVCRQEIVRFICARGVKALQETAAAAADSQKQEIFAGGEF